MLFTTAGPQASGTSWTAPTVNLLARSGKAIVNLEYTAACLGPSKAPDEAALRTTTTAMATDVLAALSHAA